MALMAGLRSDYFFVQWKRGGEVVQYEIANVYDASVSGYTGTVNYYGYLNPNGGWVIQQYDTATGIFLYCSGLNGYSTAWSGRGGLTYVAYNALFN